MRAKASLGLKSTVSAFHKAYDEDSRKHMFAFSSCLFSEFAVCFLSLRFHLPDLQLIFYVVKTCNKIVVRFQI